MCDIFPNSNFITPCWFLVAFYWTTPLVLVAHHFSNTKQWLEYTTSRCLLIMGFFALHQFMDNIGMKYSINVQKHCTMFQRCHNGALQHASLLVVSTSVHQKQCTRHHFPWRRRVWRPGHMTPFTYAATSDIPFSSFWAYFTFWWSSATAMAWPGGPASILCLTTTTQYARH